VDAIFDMLKKGLLVLLSERWKMETKTQETNNQHGHIITDRLARARVEAASRFAEACDWRWYVNVLVFHILI
jgi:hypothetical protein